MELGTKIDGSFLTLARATTRWRQLAASSRVAHLVRHLALPRPATCRSSSAPRSPPPTSRSRADSPPVLGRLTLFSDNLVPHVLRMDGS